MPDWLYRMLEKGPKATVENKITRDGRVVRIESVQNETRGLINVFAQLCQQDRGLAKAYLCHPAVNAIVKLPREGGFCGHVGPKPDPVRETHAYQVSEYPDDDLLHPKCSGRRF